MYQHVLIPTDGSEGDARAIEHGVGLADAVGATVHALTVNQGAGAMQRDRLRSDPEAEAAAAIERVERVADDAGVPVTTAVREGTDPADEILAHARDQQADLIVMGTSDPSGIDRLFDESVAESVLEDTTVPVLTVTELEG